MQLVLTRDRAMQASLFAVCVGAGEFAVMNYRVTGEFRAPFRVFPFLEETSPFKVELVVKIRADMPESNYGSNVVVRFPVPRNAATGAYAQPCPPPPHHWCQHSLSAVPSAVNPELGPAASAVSLTSSKVAAAAAPCACNVCTAALLTHSSACGYVIVYM